MNKIIRETDLGKEIRSCDSALSLMCLLDIQVKIPSRLYIAVWISGTSQGLGHKFRSHR